MKIMLGVGSGRCGTQTLAYLIKAQKEFRATHQTFSAIAKWEFSEEYFYKLVSYLRTGGSDVSFYNLPYVEKLWEVFPDLKVVCLKRDRNETIKSFKKRSENAPTGRPRNQWTSKNSIYWKNFNWSPDPLWDKCFPKFDAPKEEAIGKYWDLYYNKTEKLEKDNPNRFKIYDMYNVLNLKIDQADLLKFIGVEEDKMKFVLNKKYNKGVWKAQVQVLSFAHKILKLEPATPSLKILTGIIDAEILPTTCSGTAQGQLWYSLKGPTKLIRGY